MWRERILDHLFPAAERNRNFRREMERLSRHGLLIVGCVEIGVSLFMLGARFLLSAEGATLSLRLRQAALLIAIGGVNVAASRLETTSRWARPLALVTGFVTACTLIWSSLVLASRSPSANDFIPGQVTLVMLVAVAIVPLRPFETLALGAAIAGGYVAACRLAGFTPDENYLLFIVMLALLCTAVTAVLYAQRRAHFQILEQTVEAAEALRDAQTRIVLSESAASLSRLAAAVSHEMNTPLGALISGVDTLTLLAARQATTTTASEQARLVQLQSELRRSIQESAQRLRELVARIQRFTNLDQAEVQSADLNELLRDVAALLDPATSREIQVDLQLEPLPPVVCRPQQLSIAFSSLVNNAMQAVNGNGRIQISTRAVQGDIEVRIDDNGRGLAPAELRHIFDPDFRATGGRIAAVNWSMFNSRQIVREHGGDIQISSRVGSGTSVSIRLPVGEGNPIIA